MGEHSNSLLKFPRKVGASYAAGEFILEDNPWVWTFTWPMHRTHCINCCIVIALKNCFTCRGCREYRYCSNLCKDIHWEKEHKDECIVINNVRDWKANGDLSVRNSEVNSADCISCTLQCGCHTLEILVAKILSKYLRDVSENSDRCEKNAVEILQLLPYDPIYPFRVSEEVLEDAVQRLLVNIFPNATFPKSAKEIATLFKIIHYNMIRINDHHEAKSTLLGVGLFLGVQHREMTLVCLDHNVLFVTRGRRLLVQATEDIVDYKGLQDLRWYQSWTAAGIREPVKKIRDLFLLHNGYPCRCLKCSDRYEAEINPLVCGTPDCTARIPSDERALDPCLQCSCVNGHRLAMAVDLRNRTEEYLCHVVLHRDMAKLITRQDVLISPLYSLLCEFGQPKLFHPDAYLRCFNPVMSWIIQFCFNQGLYEEAWQLSQDVISCDRAVSSKYNLWSAAFRLMVAKGLFDWVEKSADTSHEIMVIPFNMVPTLIIANSLAAESHLIFATIHGSSCEEAKDAADVVATIMGTLLKITQL